MRNGENYRDTDWLTLTVGPTGTIEIEFDADYPTTISELTGTCEGGVTVVQQATGGPCNQAFLTINGAPGSEKWISVAPTTVEDTDGCFQNGYPYGIWLDGLMPEVVATEPATWSTIKALYE